MIPINLIDADLTGVRQERVDEIKDSIQEIGLLHPISVRANGERYELLAGKVRLKAMMDLELNEVPAQIVDESKLEHVREISLQENLRRSNLEWWEQIELEEQLHQLRIDQHGQRRTGRGASKEAGWSQQDTARELGIALGAMSQDLYLANALRRNPHLKKVKDKVTALKLAKEAARREHIESDSLIPPDFTMDQILCGDSSEILKEIPDDTFNFCLTDPPWLNFKDEHLTRDEFTLPVFKEVFRVLKRDSLLYAIVSTPDFFFYQQELPKFGFVCQEYPMIWHKTGTMTHGRRSWESGRDFEPILVAAKGNPVLTIGTEMSSIIQCQVVPSMKLIHPNEKPIELMKQLISRTTFDEGRVLDPFAGSGATLIAAKELSRPFIGIERDYKFYQKIRRRLENWNTASPS